MRIHRTSMFFFIYISVTIVLLEEHGLTVSER